MTARKADVAARLVVPERAVRIEVSRPGAVDWLEPVAARRAGTSLKAVDRLEGRR